MASVLEQAWGGGILPFNGNAKDATTNKLRGFLEGPTSTTNRFGQPNQAIALDGEDDGVSCVLLGGGIPNFL